MHLESGQFIFSPSDLTQFMDSPFASWMAHFALTHPDKLPIPDEPDAMMSVLQDKGDEHETQVLASLEAQGFEVAKPGLTNDPLKSTQQAMAHGVDIIYQAYLAAPPFKGRADFLVKTSGHSQWGDYQYEIWDTKLAKTVKPTFLIQLCCYADMLMAIQGAMPQEIVVLLGDGTKQRYRTHDYIYYYQQLKNNFLIYHERFDSAACPDPSESSHWGRWGSYAESLLAQMDHLCRVATITSSQIKKLNRVGIHSMQALADTHLLKVSGMSSAVFERLKAQAVIQKESDGLVRPRYKIIPPAKDAMQGLALLPPHSHNDLFFDIEGFPLQEGGLEYLWGVAYFDQDRRRQYRDFWAHNSEEEQAVFMAFIQWAYERWQSDPSMHIYHYANYEIAACRKLMGQYGVCEYEVDQLLRNDVFVDLYKIVKGSVLVGEPRYSIKNIEHLYRSKRATEVGSGGDSVVVYDHWRTNPDGLDWQMSAILKSLRDYNIDDCNSTQELVDWLRERQGEYNISYLGQNDLIEPEVKEENTERTALRNKLLQKAEELSAQGKSQEASIHALFAWSLEFHRREAKPLFWRLFDRLGLSDDELMDDIDCLSHCVRTGKPPYKLKPTSRNLAFEYEFNPSQEFKAAANRYFVLGKKSDEGKQISVGLIKEESSFQDGRIVLSQKEAIGDVITLIPDEYLNPEPIPTAIYRQALAFSKGHLNPSAILDFLTKQTPRIKGHRQGDAIAPSHDPMVRLKQIQQAVLNLDNSYLTIQGPPGAGKTYTGKHLIAELLKQGKRIGIASNSHKAINNLLLGTATYCQKAGISASFFCTKRTDESMDQLGVEEINNAAIKEQLSDGCVIGTTAWGFARDDLNKAFDYLFIDEAGQVSVANLIAMSQAADNLILMGDQMQLGQPSQGSHPQESGLSILDYLLHETPTIPEHLGVFLGTTYRMHSSVNAFISHAIYDGKLESAPENDKQRIIVPDHYSGPLNLESGIIPVAVEHEGNTQASEEEVLIIKELAAQLIGRTFYSKEGTNRLLDWRDILFVAPYNHQVNKLKEALGVEALVGSVDKFQGQEAPIVFLSMCASDPSDSPRGLDFLFDKHRLNVAISRAQCMAIVVYSPSLLHLSANNLRQLEYLNVFYQLVGKES